MLSSHELRQKYLDFFKSKGHAIIPSAPLVPENDPSVLFTTAGMHPLVPYLMGAAHPEGKRLADSQKCLRTTDIEEVGDATHATVFEMLGNWSLGDYFKKDAIAWSWEFLTSPLWLNLKPTRLAVSVFAGDDAAPRDEESADLWKQAGVPSERIAYLGKDDNWWPAGGKHPGPQGPDTEIFYWTGNDAPPKSFDATDSRWVEIWNNVFMQFIKSNDTLSELPQKNVDTGMGLERVVMILNGMSSIYEIDTFKDVVSLIQEKSHPANGLADNIRHERIIADHIKAATFLLGDTSPVMPSNKDQGYVLRKLIRRAVYSAHALAIPSTDIPVLFSDSASMFISQYGNHYTSLTAHKQIILKELGREVHKFEATLRRGLLKYEAGTSLLVKGDEVPAELAFDLFQSDGFPFELTRDLSVKKGLSVNEDSFRALLKEHQDTSRTASAGKFKGGLADTSDMSIKYHTATHLLHQSLREVLGTHVVQKGSNITPERLRFDFSHPEKLTHSQITQVQEKVNAQIKQNLKVIREEMSVEEAKDKGALGLFAHKYGETVSVYSMGDFSREICGGPHVAQTGELGVFTITKEESAGAGIRRIKATLS